MFKLKKLTQSPTKIKLSKTEGARARFEAGLEELRRVDSFYAYLKAVDEGVQFSFDGFRRRAKIGNQAMRTTHSDLFDELKAVLRFVHQEVLGVSKNAKGRSKGTLAITRRTELEKRLSEAEALLDRRERDFRQLLNEMRLIRSQLKP